MLGRPECRNEGLLRGHRAFRKEHCCNVAMVCLNINDPDPTQPAKRHPHIGPVPHPKRNQGEGDGAGAQEQADEGITQRAGGDGRLKGQRPPAALIQSEMRCTTVLSIPR
jgi:hypothetical protein